MDLLEVQGEYLIILREYRLKHPGVTVTYMYLFTSRFVTLVICTLDCPHS